MTAPRLAARPPGRSPPPSLARSPALDLAVALLCAATIWAPLALGATGEWTRLGLEATIAVALVLWTAAGRGSTWALALPIMLLGGVLVQVVPLPDRLLTAIAPISAGAWKIALAGTTGGWGRISVDPAATAIAARRLFLGAALVAAVTDLGRCRSYRTWLTTAISAAAVFIIGAGLLFPVVRDQSIMLGFVDLKGPIEWWRTPLAPPVQSGGLAYVENVCAGSQCYQSDLRLVGAAYGSYICCNKFAGAVCLTLPVALAAFLFWTRNRLPAPVRYAITLAVFAGAFWILAVTIYSRAGFAALVAAALALYALCVEYRPARLVAGILAGCYAAFVIAFATVLIGQFQSVAEWFPEPLRLKAVAYLTDGRAIAASVAARMFRASPILGTGLATFEDLWPRMMPGNMTWYYAHNDYAQFIAETGLAGCAVLVGFGTWIVRRFLRFARGASFPARILDAGPWAALAAIAVHSIFDWNLHVPANAFLASIVCGLAVGSAGVASRNPSTVGGHVAVRRITPTIFALVCITTLALLARDAWTDAVQRRLREAIVADRLAAADAQRPSPGPKLVAAVEAGEQAARWSPRDARLHAVLAQAHVHLAARRSLPDATLPFTTADYLEFARRHSRAALAAAPMIRGLPEPAPAPPRRFAP
jgi:hypothetical protein